MTKDKTGNNKFLKKFNQARILDLIRENKVLSKAALSQMTGLSPTATGIIVSGLLEEGYICETGTGESSGGRKPVLLALKPRSYYAVGADIEVDSVRLVLIDHTGEVVGERKEERMCNSDPEKTMVSIVAGIREMLKEHGVKKQKLLGIGVSVPGLVEEAEGRVLLAPNLGWKDVQIRHSFSELPDMPLFVENEAMASAVCEHWVGTCMGVEDFLCINVKSGIGAGIFTGGRLYRGAGGSAGEVGHILVDENGPKCGCGNYGCLETLASTARIVENAKKLIRQGCASVLNHLEDIELLEIDTVIEAARAGDEAARSVLNEAARYLGIAISNLVNTLNPGKIIIGKEFVRYADLVLEQIRDLVACKALKHPAGRVEILASEIGERSSAIGAALLPLSTLFGK